MTKQDIFNISLKTFLFLSPLYFFRSYTISTARGMFFLFGSFALFGISLVCEPKRTFYNPWVALILLAALLRVFVGDNLGTSAGEWFNFWLSSAGFIYVLAGVLLLRTVYCHAENIKQYFTPILIVCILNLILVTAQLTGHDFMWTNRPSLCGFMSISSQLGQYSALSIPLVFSINPYLAIIPLITLIASKSVSAILATFIGAIVFLALVGRNKKIIALVVVLGIGLGALNFGYVKTKWRCRPIMWEKTLKVALQKPYLGHGYQSFNEKVVQGSKSVSIGGTEFSRAHNDYLHNSQELGFPIVIFVVGLLASLWKKFKGTNKDALVCLLATSVLIVLINSCGQTLIRYAEISGTFIVILSLFMVKLKEV